MKNFKTLTSIITLGVFIFGATANAADIDSIQVIDDKNINLIASEEIVFDEWSDFWEVRVIKDIEVTYAQIDTQDSTKVLLNLGQELKSGEGYNLLWAYGADWDMDFSVSENLVWEIANLSYDDDTKSIKKINILDPKTIEIYYNYEVDSQILEYKILSELSIDWFSSDTNNVLNIDLIDSLDKSTSYMLMVSDFVDIDWNDISFDEYLYDFETSSSLIKTISEQEVQKAVEDMTNEESSNQDQWELNEVEELALNAAENPEVWAATWFVMLLTFVVSSAYFMRNKFIK